MFSLNVVISLSRDLWLVKVESIWLSTVVKMGKLFNLGLREESDYRFCLILWEHEPIKSSELVKICKEQLGWKPTTTYTVIKRLSERGVLKNEKTIVSSLVTKDEIQAAELNEMVEKTFEGSLPAFIAAFSRCKKLSADEVAQLREMIDKFQET